MVAENINAWSTTWSSWIVSTLWQSTLLAIVVGVLAYLLRSSSPAVRYWLWQVVAIKLLLVPLWSFAVPVEWLPQSWREVLTQASPAIASPTDTIVATNATLKSNEPSRSHSPQSSPLLAELGAMPNVTARALTWTAWLMIGWMVIVIAQVLLLVLQRVRLARLLATCVPAPQCISALVADCAAQLKLARVPGTWTTELDCSPFVCGLWRPALVFPRALEGMLTAGEIAPILMHELAHLRRRDLLWNWLPQLARMLFFFHPIAHWASFRIRLEAELACDGLAMTTSGQAPAAYAELLVRVVSCLSEPSLLRSGSVASATLSDHLPFRTDQEDRT